MKEHIWTNHCERESSELEREKRSCRGERKRENDRIREGGGRESDRARECEPC